MTRGPITDIKGNIKNEEGIVGRKPGVGIGDLLPALSLKLLAFSFKLSAFSF